MHSFANFWCTIDKVSTSIPSFYFVPESFLFMIRLSLLCFARKIFSLHANGAFISYELGFRTKHDLEKGLNGRCLYTVLALGWFSEIIFVPSTFIILLTSRCVTISYYVLFRILVNCLKIANVENGSLPSMWTGTFIAILVLYRNATFI